MSAITCPEWSLYPPFGIGMGDCNVCIIRDRLLGRWKLLLSLVSFSSIITGQNPRPPISIVLGRKLDSATPRGWKIYHFAIQGCRSAPRPGYHLASLQDAVPLRAALRPAPYSKLRNIQNRIVSFERKCFKMNVIGKREERKSTGYPRISGADRQTPLPGARGVKGPEGWRSPRSGGLRGGPEHGEHLWELRQRVCEADRAVVRMRRMPKLGDDFNAQDIGGEILTRRDCPVFSGVAFLAVLGLATTPCTQTTRVGEVVRQRAEIRGRRSVAGCDFVSQATGDKWLMPQDCPEIGGASMGALRWGRGTKDWTVLSSLAGLAPGPAGQPTVQNGGLLSVVPTGLQCRARLRPAPTPSRMRDGESKGPRIPRNIRNGFGRRYRKVLGTRW